MQPNLEWYSSVLNQWHIRELRAAAEKLLEYGHTGEDVFALVKDIAGENGDVLEAILALTRRHSSALNRDLPEIALRKRAADLFGYACLLIAYLDYISDVADSPS